MASRVFSVPNMTQLSVATDYQFKIEFYLHLQLSLGQIDKVKSLVFKLMKAKEK